MKKTALTILFLVGILFALSLPSSSIAATFDPDSPLVERQRYFNPDIGNSRNFASFNGANIQKARLLIEEDEENELPAGASVSYFLSNEGYPYFWKSISPGQTIEFKNKGDDLYVKVSIMGSNVDEDEIDLADLEIWYRKDVNDSGSSGRFRDNRRRRDISELEEAIVEFYQRHDHDPIVPRGSSNDDRMRVLFRLLEQNEILDEDDIEDIQDPLAEDSELNDIYEYKYQIRPGGNGFVLAARFENKESRYLEDDVDGEILNINCNDPVYCITRGFDVQEYLQAQTQDQERQRQLDQLQEQINELKRQLNDILRSRGLEGL